MPYAHVVLPLPVFEPYTYRVPDALADRVQPGARVIVPLRRAELVGLVTALDVPPPPLPPDRAPRDILAVPDPEPALSGPLLALAGWLARYYGAPLGLAVRAMLPGGMWGRSSVRLVLRQALSLGGLAGELLGWLAARGGTATVTAAARAFRRPLWDVVGRLARVGAVELAIVPPSPGPGAAREAVVVLHGDPLTLVEREQRFRRRPRQRALYETLEQSPAGLDRRHLVAHFGFNHRTIGALVRDGLARIEPVEMVRDPFAGEPATPPPGPLLPAQRRAVEAIGAATPGAGVLVFGVTGSGKTLVYLEAMRRTLDAGRGAILLVPEIGLTPQTVSRVRGLFGDQVAVLHSGLSEGERADAWRLLRAGARRVAVGARSAVFAPVPNLGLIVVDEEHDASYKNGETPRYHARDVAARRAQLEGATLVLGSATPSLESMARVGSGLCRVDLPERVQRRPLPPVTLVDLRAAPLVRSVGSVPWSEALDEAVATTLAAGDQVLLLLNRRGYASFLQCHACGQVPECRSCSISLTVHRAPPPAGLRCHYCGHRAPIPARCEACGQSVHVARGVGTQQVERLVVERYPDARVARMDLDTTGARWSHHRILGAVSRGEVNVLVGTQMIAKGIDLPEVTLVGVVDADLALHLPDFRAAERTFHLLTQVAGRAGRGNRGGRVLIQTRQPDHHALARAAHHDVEGFLAEERRLRERPPYPPLVGLVHLVAAGVREPEVARRAAALADWCSELAARHGLSLAVLGPAPCPLARIQNRWRWHVLLKAPPRELSAVVRALAPRLGEERGVRVILDRDPVSLL